MDKPLPYHDELRSLLEDLAELEPRVGPDELRALWFDTLYWLGQSYVRPDHLSHWSACFNERELKAMAEFHIMFDELHDQLPGWGTDWRSSPQWRQVAAAAKLALNDFTAVA